MTAATRWLLLVALIFPAGFVRGYLVGPAVPLDDLAGQADLIFQGTVVSSKTVDDPAFPATPGFSVQETDFQPAWPIKGGRSLHGEIKFRHYAIAPASGGMMYAPQHYEFEPGKAYLVFARQPPGSPPDVCRQIWMSSTGMDDEGVLLCFRAAPFGHGPMKDLFWRDLTGLLKSSDPKDVIYAVRHLDLFSGGNGSLDRFGTLSVFQRLDVLVTIHELIDHPDPAVAQATLLVVGSHNPYMTRERAQFWLATVGSANTPGFAKMDPGMVNEGGLIYWREIAAVVDGKADEATRALAVTALGLVREPSLQGSVARWLADPGARVRSAAVLLLADYPALASPDRFVSLAGDADLEIRISTAFAIGFGQLVDDAGVLTRLMADPEAKVRQAASMSLLSFSPQDERIAKIFRDNLTNKEFGPLFLVALAQENPGENLDLLTQEVEKKTDPANWPGGQIPAYTASHLLYNYLETQPVADLKAGKFDRALNALEIWQPNYSVDPQFVYALELRCGLTERARKFRVAVDKTSPYDLETFFKRADENPAMYDIEK